MNLLPSPGEMQTSCELYDIDNTARSRYAVKKHVYNCRIQVCASIRLWRWKACACLRDMKSGPVLMLESSIVYTRIDVAVDDSAPMRMCD